MIDPGLYYGRFQFITKINTDGSLLWGKRYYEEADPYEIMVTSDGGFMLFNHHFPQNTILKLNAEGQEVWHKEFDSKVYTGDMIEMDDGYLCLASVHNYNYLINNSGIGIHHYCTYKLDFDGNVVWIGEPIDNDQPGFSSSIIKELPDKNYYVMTRTSNVIMTTTTPFITTSPRILRTKISPSGKILEQRISTDTLVTGFSFDVFPDNSLILLNGIISWNSINYISRTDTLQHLACRDSIVVPQKDSVNISVLPASSVSISEVDVLLIQKEVIISEPEIFLEHICDNIQNESIDTFMCRGDLLAFNVDFYNAESFLWQDGSTEPIIEITEPGIYEVEIAFCNNVITKTITVLDAGCNCVDIPNAFTPDGDGLNDSFSPSYNCKLKNATLKIYNRWGNLVFFTHDRTAKWNGQHNGKAAVSDVYVYILIYETELGVTNKESGDVTLIR